MEPEEALHLLVLEYDRMAAAYDTNAAPYYRPAAKELLEMAAVREGEALLDMGCGTGNMALESVAYVGPAGLVVGIDLARGMVGLSRRKARAKGLPYLRFLQMDARQLAFRDGSFDVVASCLGIPGFGHAYTFSEAHRVLRDGGRFVFCVGTGKTTAVPFVRLLEEYVLPILRRRSGVFWRLAEALRRQKSQQFSVIPAGLERPFEQAGSER